MVRMYIGDHSVLFFATYAETYVDEALFKKIEDYREKWHAEVTNYVEVKEDIEHLRTDVEDVKQILQDFEKGDQS